jgi:hypothetical protein
MKFACRKSTACDRARSLIGAAPQLRIPISPHLFRKMAVDGLCVA